MQTLQNLYDQLYEIGVRKARFQHGLKDDDAEQVTIDALLDLYTALEQGAKEEWIVPLFYKIIHARTVDHLRANKHIRRIDAPVQIEFSDSIPGAAVDHAAFNAIDARDEVHAAWSLLTANEKKLATMAFIDDEPREKIAKVFRIPLRNVYRRIRKLRKKLRNAIQYQTLATT